MQQLGSRAQPAELPAVPYRQTARAFIALIVALATGIVALTAGFGLTGSAPAAIAAAVLGALLAGWVAWRRPIVAIDTSGLPRRLVILSSLATIGALVVLGRLAVFMIDPSRTEQSLVPTSAWEVGHSCLTAYYVAGQAVGQGQNPYDNALYSAPDDDPAATRKPRKLGSFNVDVYEYPPPFLLLPRLCSVLAPDFLRLRSLWFALNLAIVLVALPIVARTLAPAAATRAMLLSPLVVFAMHTLSGLQKGNIQLAVIALSMLAMVFFERRWWAAGGALLAFTTVSKLFPGLLVLYLVARRQWRAVFWTTAMGFAYALATLLDIGWTPFQAFFAHLPGLLGGEAFPAFRNPAATAINASLPGLVFKLKLFGVPGMGFVAARIVGTASTLAVIWMILRAARQRPDGPTPLLWLSILVLATLCSPFLPQAYSAYPPVWLLTLLAATATPSLRTFALTIAAVLGLNVFWPVDWPIDARSLALLNAVPQALTVGIAVVGMRRGAAMGAIAKRFPAGS